MRSPSSPTSHGASVPGEPHEAYAAWIRSSANVSMSGAGTVVT
jgi:hypothetical protein